MGLFGLSRKERAAYEAEAARLGLEFSVKDPFGISSRDNFLLPAGRAAGAANVFHGPYRGGPVRLFDYVAEQVDRGVVPLPRELEHTRRPQIKVTGAWAELAGRVPLVLLVPVDSEARFRGEVPTGEPRIDDRFRCSAPYADAARAIGESDGVARLLATAPPDCAVELDGQHLLLVVDRRPLERLAPMADFLVKLRAALPPTLNEIVPPG